MSVLQPICNQKWLLIAHYTQNNSVVTVVYDAESDDLKDHFSSSFPLWDISNPQKVWSAITYAKRYNLCQIFNIITDRDDDGNEASLSEKPSFTSEDMERLTEKMKSKNPPFSSVSEALDAIEKKWTLSEIQKTAIGVLLMKS